MPAVGDLVQSATKRCQCRTSADKPLSTSGFHAEPELGRADVLRRQGSTNGHPSPCQCRYAHTTQRDRRCSRGFAGSHERTARAFSQSDFRMTVRLIMNLTRLLELDVDDCTLRRAELLRTLRGRRRLPAGFLRRERRRRPFRAGTAFTAPCEMPPARACDPADQHPARPQRMATLGRRRWSNRRRQSARSAGSRERNIQIRR